MLQKLYIRFPFFFVNRVCVWTSLLLFLLAIFNACTIITRFTRVAGELFGMLISVLFIQEAIKVLLFFFFLNFFPVSLVLILLPSVDASLFENDKIIMIVTSNIESQGVVSEFQIPKGENPAEEQNQFHWLYTNGLLSVIFSFGVLITALKSRNARSWRYGTGTGNLLYR